MSALVNLQGCLKATDTHIFKEATDNIHDYTENVIISTGVLPSASLAELFMYFQIKSPGLLGIFA